MLAVTDFGPVLRMSWEKKNEEGRTIKNGSKGIVRTKNQELRNIKNIKRRGT
jgi:hypothetical protein